METSEVRPYTRVPVLMWLTLLFLASILHVLLQVEKSALWTVTLAALLECSQVLD